MWIKPIVEARSPEHHILCVPWAGAGPESFFPWRGALSPGMSMSVVHLPGRSTRYSEPLVSSTKEIVGHAVAAIPAEPSPPMTIFGHSFGAILAFEIARRLEQEGRPPRRLLVSGSSAPHVVVIEEKVAHLPANEFLAKVGEYGGLPPEILANRHLLEIFTPILQADFAALEGYTFDDPRPLACPIVVLSGRADPLVNQHGLDAWHQMSSVRCEVHLFDGGHFFFQGRERSILELILGG